MSDPVLVPTEFEATSRKWYVVAEERPDSAALTLTAERPEPTLAVAVLDPYELLVPYWKWYVVAAPFGFTVPFSVAAEALMPEADSVATLGAAALRFGRRVLPAAVVAARVRKVIATPRSTPREFLAISRNRYVCAALSPRTEALTGTEDRAGLSVWLAVRSLREPKLQY